MTKTLFIEVDEQGAIEIRADWVPQYAIEVMGVLKLAGDVLYADYMAGRTITSKGECEYVQPAVCTIRVHPRELSS